MKYRQKVLFSIVSLIAIITIFISLHHQTQMTRLQQENHALSIENLTLQARATYQLEDVSIDLQDDYHHWATLEEMAEQMVNDSGGNFKKSWAIYLANEAKQYEVDPFLVYELLKIETGGVFDPELVGPETRYGHAYGMSQFMKNTAPWIADMAGLPYSEELLFDPYYSMQLAIVYLDFLHHKYQDWDQALTAYHRGMSGLENYIMENGTAESDYARRIQTNAEQHHAVVMAN
ncbi:lytic transglycosylase domain-containing protein [Amphibacillus jilinensis]|uniref:lytic transglycosylase domain-containing protein n=1 Tax=Amphibacillus jilinensis TaxID=1216008 RepID=UPI000311E98B|nr:transglycosylase SLT domain-containing protein [Amphibacillus jilinensis]